MIKTTGKKCYSIVTSNYCDNNLSIQWIAKDNVLEVELIWLQLEAEKSGDLNLFSLLTNIIIPLFHVTLLFLGESAGEKA